MTKKRKAPWRRVEAAAPVRASKASPPRSMTPVKYAKAWDAYKASPTISAVVKGAEVSEDVARKLVRTGYPEYGMDALQVRFAQRSQQLAAVADEGELELMQQVAKESRQVQLQAYNLLAQALGEATTTDVIHVDENSGQRILKTKEFAKLFEVFDKAGRLASFAGGGADSRSEHVIPTGVLSENDLAALMLEATQTIDGELDE